MPLDPYALMTLQQARDWLNLTNEQPSVAAFSVYHDKGASATAATVTVTDTTLVLTIAGGTNAGTDTFTLAHTSVDTLAELVAAITALNKGWQVILLGNGAATSTWLIPRAAISVYGQENTLQLEYADQTVVENAINAASAAIETYLDRKIIARDYVEWLDTPAERVNLLQYPIRSIERVASGRESVISVQNSGAGNLHATIAVGEDRITLSHTSSLGITTITEIEYAAAPTSALMVDEINALGNGWNATLNSNVLCKYLIRSGGMNALVPVSIEWPNMHDFRYRVEADRGQIVFDEPQRCEWSPHWSCKDNIVIGYNAGYTATPYDILAFCAMIVQVLLYSRDRDASLKSESLGDFSYSRADFDAAANAALLGADTSLIDKYKRRVA